MRVRVIVARGRHRDDFELLDQDGVGIGGSGCRSAPFLRIPSRWRPDVLMLQEVGPDCEVFGRMKWQYEAVIPGSASPRQRNESQLSRRHSFGHRGFWSNRNDGACTGRGPRITRA